MIEKIREEGEEVALSGSTAKSRALVAVNGEGGATPGAGDTSGALGSLDTKKAVEESERREREKQVAELVEPRQLEFVLDLPSVTAMDL